MKILITGISGFIGSAVFKKFQNHEIYTIDNCSFGDRSLIDIPQEQFYVEDIRNRKKVFEIFSEVNRVYHGSSKFPELNGLEGRGFHGDLNIEAIK